MTELSQSDQNNPQGTSPHVAEDKLATIAERLPSLFGESCELDRSADELKLKCDVSDLVYVLKTLRDDPVLQFKQLTDLTAVDYPERAQRFEVVYQMLSLALNARMRVLTSVEDGDIVP